VCPNLEGKFPTLDVTRILVSRSNGRRTMLEYGHLVGAPTSCPWLEAVGGIPCRPNPEATLLIFNIHLVHIVACFGDMSGDMSKDIIERVHRETATCFRSVDGFSRVLETRRTFMNIRSSETMEFQLFISSWAMNGATHHSYRSRPGTSNKSYDTPSRHCS